MTMLLKTNFFWIFSWTFHSQFLTFLLKLL